MGKGLEELMKRVQEMGRLHTEVGWLDTAKYEDGTPVAYVASIQEFGGTANIKAGQVTIHRSVNKKTGELKNGGKFTAKAKANLSTTHNKKAHTIVIPPRPFMRTTIVEQKNSWSEKARQGFKAVSLGVKTPLQVMTALGELAAGDVRMKITQINSPPLKNSTYYSRKRRGLEPNKPLQATGLMLSTCTSIVKEK